MPNYAAFLRAINLGRRRRVSGAQLRERFEGLGLADVGTFRTSGNVVFAVADRPPGDGLASRIESDLEQAFGYPIAAFLRSAEEVRAIARQRPFDEALVAASNGKLQVTLLAREPSPVDGRAVLALASDEDRLAFGDRELYWLPSAGTQRSALDWKAIEGLVGPTTMRTKGTVELLAAKYF
jgi:uncharacterized protein (DUF1697 family)